MLKFPQDLAERLAKRFEESLSGWLEAEITHAPFAPVEISVAVSRREAGEDIVLYNRWEKAWTDLEARFPGSIVLRRSPAAWQQLGRTEKITHVVLTRPEGVFSLIPDGERAAELFSRAVARLVALQEGTEPSRRLAFALARQARNVYESDEGEFERLTGTVLWLAAHRPALCYMRELPIEGADSKWLEKHRALCARLLTAVMAFPAPLTAEDVEREWQIASPPLLAGVRHAHLSVPGLQPDDYVGLSLDVLSRVPRKRVVIVENKQTGLSLHVEDEALIVCGMGRSVVSLARIPWMAQTQIDYMGDLDQHGLVILAELRAKLPKTASVLMDEETFERYGAMAVPDPTLPLAMPAQGLTSKELDLFELVQRSRLRLEQERIPLDAIESAFAAREDL